MRLLRVERHHLGPRVYVLGRRIHEYQLGLVLIAAALAAILLGDRSTHSVLIAGSSLWLFAKDWRDLFPATRDKAAWQLGLHRPPPALRRIRCLGSLPLVAGLVAAAVAA